MKVESEKTVEHEMSTIALNSPRTFQSFLRINRKDRFGKWFRLSFHRRCSDDNGIDRYEKYRHWSTQLENVLKQETKETRNIIGNFLKRCGGVDTIESIEENIYDRSMVKGEIVDAEND